MVQTPGHGSDKLSIYMYVVIMSKERSTKIVNFMTPGAGVPVRWCDNILSYRKNALFL